MGLILLVVALLFIVGALPRWSHSRKWGYGPSGFLGTALVVVVVLVALGYLR